MPLKQLLPVVWQASQGLHQRWADMPIAEGILGSLEQLGDISTQWSSIVQTPIQWEAWSMTEHIHPSTPWPARWIHAWSESAKRDKRPRTRKRANALKTTKGFVVEALWLGQITASSQKSRASFKAQTSTQSPNRSNNKKPHWKRGES